MVTEICELPPASLVAITFWGVADWKMGAAPQKTNFQQILDHLPGVKTTLFSITETIFFTPPYYLVGT